MLVSKDYREKARESLRGKWALAVGTGFVASLLGAYTAFSSGSGSSDSSDTMLEENLANLPEVVVGIIAIILMVMALFALIMAVIHFILSGPISLGYAKFNLNLIDGKNAQFSDLFSEFDQFGKAFVMQLLRSVFIFLWTLLFVIPGIVATCRYAMTPYIMLDHPELSASEAIEESKRLMEGNKWDLFCLSFSFIGWSLLCVLTLGIGYLWLRPYEEAAYAAFYKEIRYGKYSQPEGFSNFDNFDNFNQ